MFGTRAMVNEYAFGLYDLEHAIKLVLQLCVDQETSDNGTITRLSNSVVEVSLNIDWIEYPYLHSASSKLNMR